MPSQKRDELLTELEKNRLVDRSTMTDLKARAANDLRVRRKLSAWLKNIPDVLLILCKIPNDQIREEISDEDIYRLFTLTEKMMKIEDFRAIVGDMDQHPDKWKVVNKPGEMGPNRKPGVQDIWRSLKTLDHIKEMYVFHGDRNPVRDYALLAKMDEVKEFHDRVNEEERHALEIIREVLKNPPAQ